MKTDILIILKEGSRDKDIALKIALRSLEQNCRNVGRVFLCGAIPEWVNPETVMCVPKSDIFKRKHKNILDGIIFACGVTDIGGDDGHFMLMSDDHWYIKSTWFDFQNTPMYFKGRIHTRQDIMKEPNDNYKKSMFETREVMRLYDLDTINFAQHANTWWNAELVREQDFRDIANYAARETDYGIEPSCLMGNYWLSRRPQDFGGLFNLVYRKDYKISDEVRNWATVEDDLQDQSLWGINQCRECVSGTDRIWQHGVGEAIKRQFKNKSRYEI